MYDLKLDLLRFKNDLVVRSVTGERELFDPVRKRYVQMTPEEFVRQLFILYLFNDQGISRGRVAVERKLTNLKLDKRFDVLIFDQNAQPWMVVECKSAEVSITQSVLDQAGIYNSVIRAPYLLVTNGVESFVFHIDFKSDSFRQLNSFPDSAAKH